MRVKSTYLPATDTLMSRIRLKWKGESGIEQSAVVPYDNATADSHGDAVRIIFNPAWHSIVNVDSHARGYWYEVEYRP